MTPLMPPFEGHGPRGLDGAFSVLPFLGSFLLLLVLLAGLAMLYLSRQGKLTLPSLGAHRAPEDDAKRILAERFARGDISSDDFLERSSVLNWTPGSVVTPPRPRKKRG